MEENTETDSFALVIPVTYEMGETTPGEIVVRFNNFLSEALSRSEFGDIYEAGYVTFGLAENSPERGRPDGDREREG